MSSGTSDSGNGRPGRRGPVLARRRAPGDKQTPRQPARVEPAPPLDRLHPERLSGFLELALVPSELLRLCRKLGVSPKGYRIEKLSAPDHAALLADEYDAEKKSRPVIEEAVAQALKSPALRTMWLTGVAARELAQLVAGDPITAEARLAWRFIGDGDPGVRAAAERSIDAGLALLDQLDDAADQERPARPAAQTTARSQEKAGAADADDDATKRAARAERDRESARAQLQQARSEIAERDKRINELKGELAQARVTEAQQLAELSKLSAAQSSDERRSAHEVRKLSAEKHHLENRIAELDERLETEKRRGAELTQQLQHERERERPALNQPPDEPADAASAHDFLVPFFTDEFYESVKGWDRRVVKNAFDKALALARDRRHPSLRALPLEGVENLFRIRIASDVRLIYRRGAEGRLEILSLIDREDLDRYVRQAKTRSEG